MSASTLLGVLGQIRGVTEHSRGGGNRQHFGIAEPRRV